MELVCGLLDRLLPECREIVRSFMESWRTRWALKRTCRAL